MSKEISPHFLARSLSPEIFFTDNSSQLFLSNSQIFVDGSAIFSSQNISVDGNSTVNVASCVNINGGNLQISDSVIREYLSGDIQNITVITSKAGCISGNFSSVMVGTTNSCRKVVASQKQTDDSVFVVFNVNDSECDQGMPIWLIFVILIPLIILIVVGLIATRVRRIQRLIFPLRGIDDWEISRAPSTSLPTSMP